MTERISRSCYLKKVVITRLANSRTPRKTLCEYLRDVFAHFPKANDRKRQLNEDKDRYQVMNDWRFLGGGEEVCAAEAKLERVSRALAHALKGFEELQEAVK